MKAVGGGTTTDDGLAAPADWDATTDKDRVVESA